MIAFSAIHVLLVEDTPAEALIVQKGLADYAGFHLTRVERLGYALATMSARPFDVVLLDLGLPDSQGLDTLRTLRLAKPSVPVVVLAATDDEELALQTVQAGAQDYLVKDQVQNGILVRSIRYAIERQRADEAIARSNERLRILHQIDRALIAAEGPEAIAAACLPPLRELLGVPRVVVNLFDLATGQVEWLASAGRRRVHVGPGIRYSIQLMGDLDALRRGESQLIDVHALPQGPEVDALLASGVHTYVVVPMIAGGELIGAISFGGEFGPFSAEQVSIAQDAATQFAIVLTQSRLHERVKRQAQELRSAFEDTNVAMVLMDANNRFVRVNAAFARMFGYSEQDILGMSMPDITHPDDVAASYAQRELLKAGRMSHFQIEKRYLHKEGQLVWGLANVSLIRDVQGQPFQYIGQIQDITERKRAEANLRAAQDRLQHVVASSPAVLYTVATEGKVIRGVTWVSENIHDLLGYSVAETHGGAWWLGNIHAEDRESVLAEVQRQLFTEDCVVNEYRFRHKNGKYRWVRSDMRLLRDEGGQPQEVVGSWSDITERRLLEEQFRQAQKMDAIGQLAGGVAHDFNNLLTIINGYSTILQMRLPTDSAERDMIREIGQAGERAASLTRQLLAFSRKQVLEPKVLCLNTVVTEAGQLLRRLIGDDISVFTALEPDLSKVKADPGQIEQVLINLAVNARDAMPTGGKLTIETTNTALDATYTEAHSGLRPGPYVLLAVSDMGTGMDAATKVRIFEPFFTTKEAGKGTGLGLATVFGIVKQSGGHIAVYSELGLGTTFKVYLPMVEEIVLPRKTEQGVAVPVYGTETILLTEDEPTLRSLAAYVLEEQGHTVLQASDGENALKVASEHKGTIHLLVTDVVMPGMNGRQLAERLTLVRSGIRVLYLSGYTDDAVVRHGVLQAETAFLQKPFTPEALAGKVREVLDR